MADPAAQKALFESLLVGKAAGRQRAAALPFAEKIARMVSLQATVRALRAATAATSAVQAPPRRSTINRWVKLHALDSRSAKAPAIPRAEAQEPVQGAISGTSQCSRVQALAWVGQRLQQLPVVLALPPG
jgi:hypothetical protein